jgi:hypothetical protein
MACSRRLSPLAQQGQIRHCLELVFDIQVDHAQIARNQKTLWQGERGELNLDRLDRAREFTQEDRDDSPLVS